MTTVRGRTPAASSPSRTASHQGHTVLLPGRAHPMRRRRRWIGRSLLAALLVTVTVLGYHAFHHVVSNLGGPTCQAVALSRPVGFAPEQMASAATITAVAVRRELPARAATIALATALQESKLRNLTYGDRDSLGLFQQRTSQGWGTSKQILDPVHASNAFYDALVKVKGYQDMSITKVAQKVQHSAYPAAYATHEQEGRVLSSALSGLSPGGLGCRLDPSDRSGDPAAVRAQLGRELGLTGTVSGGTLKVQAPSERLAWAAGAWAVAHAEASGATRVQVGDRVWTRSREDAALSWAPARRSASSARTVRIELP